MTPSELRETLKAGVELLKKDNPSKEIVKFWGVYSQFYLITDEDNFICLCAEKYGYLTKVNPKRLTEKIVRLFYADMTEKVC